MNIPSIHTIRQLELDGMVTVRSRDDLIIANYSHKCYYKQHWTDATKALRGLILRVNKPWPETTEILEIVARPFTKMSIDWTGDEKLTQALEKVDGAMMVLYRHNGQFRLASRGAFEGPEADIANTLLLNYDLSCIPTNWTLLFELITPKYKHVINYGQREELVLIGALDRFSKQDWGYPKLKAIAELTGFGLPKLYPEITTMQQAVSYVKDLPATHEGLVVTTTEGVRYKIKGRKYVERHRIVSKVSPTSVLELLRISEEAALDYIDKMPEELYPVARSWLNEQRTLAYKILAVAQEEYLQNIEKTGAEYARWAKSVIIDHEPIGDILFDLRDGHNPLPRIYNHMLKGRFGYAPNMEDK